MFFYNFFFSILTLAYVKRRLSLHFGVMGFLKGMDFLIFLSFGFDALTFLESHRQTSLFGFKDEFPHSHGLFLESSLLLKRKKKRTL